MLKVAVARNTGQDLCKLLGVTRLTFHQQLVCNELAKELMDSEFTPRDLLQVFGGGNTRSDG